MRRTFSSKPCLAIALLTLYQIFMSKSSQASPRFSLTRDFEFPKVPLEFVKVLPCSEAVVDAAIEPRPPSETWPLKGFLPKTYLSRCPKPELELLPWWTATASKKHLLTNAILNYFDLLLKLLCLIWTQNEIQTLCKYCIDLIFLGSIFVRRWREIDTQKDLKSSTCRLRSRWKLFDDNQVQVSSRKIVWDI